MANTLLNLNTTLQPRTLLAPNTSLDSSKQSITTQPPRLITSVTAADSSTEVSRSSSDPIELFCLDGKRSFILPPGGSVDFLEACGVDLKCSNGDVIRVQEGDYLQFMRDNPNASDTDAADFFCPPEEAFGVSSSSTGDNVTISMSDNSVSTIDRASSSTGDNVTVSMSDDSVSTTSNGTIMDVTDAMTRDHIVRYCKDGMRSFVFEDDAIDIEAQLEKNCMVQVFCPSAEGGFLAVPEEDYLAFKEQFPFASTQDEEAYFCSPKEETEGAQNEAVLLTSEFNASLPLSEPHKNKLWVTGLLYAAASGGIWRLLK